jgi:hypothetical protein
VQSRPRKVAGGLLKDPMLKGIPFDEILSQTIIEYAKTLTNPSFYKPRPPRLEEMPQYPYSKHMNHHRFIPASADKHTQINEDFFRVVHKRVKWRVKDALLKQNGWKLRHIRNSDGTATRRWIKPARSYGDHDEQVQSGGLGDRADRGGTPRGRDAR